MARSTLTDIEREKAALKAQLARCRRDGADSLHDLARSFDIPRQLQASLRSGAWRWAVGALAAGAAVGFLLIPRRSKKSHDGNSGSSGKNVFTSALVQGLIALAKPALGGFARKEVEKWIKGALHKP